METRSIPKVFVQKRGNITYFVWGIRKPLIASKTLMTQSLRDTG